MNKRWLHVVLAVCLLVLMWVPAWDTATPSYSVTELFWLGVVLFLGLLGAVFEP